MKTATPLTDGRAFHRITGLASPQGDVVGVEFARALERQLEAETLICDVDSRSSRAEIYYLCPSVKICG